MTSRHSSITSDTSTSSRPRVRAKPALLQGNSLNGLLNKNLTEDSDVDDDNEIESRSSNTHQRAQLAISDHRHDSRHSEDQFAPEPPEAFSPRTRYENNSSSEADSPILNHRRTRSDVRSSTPGSSDINRRRLLSDDGGSNRLVIAIDYGTTFTGVAFATPKMDEASLTDIEVIKDWRSMSNHSKIPSVISYTPSSKYEQWGASISEDAVTMLNTKMELDVQDDKLDELELILQVLEGTHNLDFDNVKRSKGNPDYTWKEPEEIVVDYLGKIFECVHHTFIDNSFQERNPSYLGEDLLAKMSVDIVVTVPVKWSYQAQNSTFRAVSEAGFNRTTFPNLGEIIVVTEPEVAAIFTARYLKEDKNTEFLKLNECFILCDAGGGTVDCVAYKVVKLDPLLELERITIATNAKCGSSYIDANFKQHLRKVLGTKYSVLDSRKSGQNTSHTMEGKHMRAIIREFDTKKRAFSNRTEDVHLDLPPPLNTLNVPNKVTQGDLKLSYHDMKSFFDPCVDGVIELILGQIQQVEKKRNRVKNVFLVGGFGESKFLQEEMKKSLDLRRIAMRRPDKQNAWTAVVQGAVMYGIEKNHHQKNTTMSACSRSYGIAYNETSSTYNYHSADTFKNEVTDTMMAHQQLSWLVRRGDLILSDEARESEKKIQFPFLDTKERRFKIPVYEYPDDDDDVPDRLETGINELIEKATLDCDLTAIPITEFDCIQNPTTNKKYYVAYLVCKITMTGDVIDFAILWNGNVIDSKKITVEVLS